MSAFATVSYPAKERLTRSEAMEELATGPRLDWFRVWADHMHAAPRTGHPWGYVHVHNVHGENPVTEVVGFWSRSALRWGLHRLYTTGHEFLAEDVDGLFNDHECHGVFYWLPGDPHVLDLTTGVNR